MDDEDASLASMVSVLTADSSGTKSILRSRSSSCKDAAVQRVFNPTHLPHAEGHHCRVPLSITPSVDAI